MRGRTHSIAIVGGGFSGTALATHLLEAGEPGLTIHVIDPRPQLGWGTAYGDADGGHILNVPAARMGIWSDTPDDFLEWARIQGPSLGWPQAAAATGATYLPRRLFGHYVQDRFERAAARARTIGRTMLVRHVSHVTTIAPHDGGFRLSLPAGGTIAAHQVVLATGFPAPSVPFPVRGQGRGLIADPWVAGCMQQIERHHNVLIVGTGLSMVDVLGTLERARHRGEVVAVSRHGLLPRTHGHSIELPPLLGAEDGRKGIRHCLAAIRHAIAVGQGDWRSVVDGLRPVIDTLWRALAPAEQDRFLRHLKPFWEVHRHRVPAESADLILRRIALGTLRIEAARIAALTCSEEGVEAELRFRASGVTRNRHFHWAVNCTPPASPFRSPLISALAAAGLARPDRTGMGVDVTAEGTLRDRHGFAIEGLFALGPLRRGHAIETTAVPHIRPQLEALAAHLLGHGHPLQRRANS